MAEAFPSAILDTVLKQLESPIFQRNSKLNWNLDIQLRDLRSKLELIKAVIYDAELMGIMFPEFFREWMVELENILYEVDDLLDEALIRCSPESSMLEKVRLRLYNLPFQYLKFAHKMKNLNKRLEGIVQKCYECNLLVVEYGGSGSDEKPVARKGILRYNPDYVKDDEFQMIGRDEDKKKVIEILLDENCKDSVLGITGPAGVGKTTLCRAVYNDEMVSNHFDFRLWVNVEGIEEFSSKELLKKILRACHGSNDDLPHLETESQLRSSVGDSKALLVLDGSPRNYDRGHADRVNTWTTMQELGKAVPAGCRILVPIIIDSGFNQPSHELQNKLSEWHSWFVFQNTALVPIKKWVDELGGQIVRRCEGNPALLKGVGTLLHGKVSEDDKPKWEYFARDYNFRGRYCHYHSMLSSYYSFKRFHQSIGYLSLFVEDDLKYEDMIKQFAANGFTNMSDKLQQDFKDTYLSVKVECVGWGAEEYEDWDVEKYEGLGAAEEYKINFYKRETIEQLSLVDNNFIGWEDGNICERRLPELTQAARRHVSIVRPPSSTEQKKQGIIRLPYRLIDDVIHKRSLHFHGKGFPIRMPAQTLDTLASNLRYLRVLDLQGLALKDLPNSISKLIHLRYLDVSRSDFKELPVSICRLKRLQTLRLVYCDKLMRLPDRIKNIRNLKHLEIDMCLDLTYMPPQIAKLTCLQRLDRFVVCPRKGGLRYLAPLENLKGHLAIEFPRHWENSGKDAEKANLERKKGLTFLEFKCQGTETGDQDNDNANVLEKLKPSSCIEKLSIVNFAGITFPSWITPQGMGTCLIRITISRCKTCNTLPPLHGFPNLKYLSLTSIMKVEYLQDSNHGGDDHFLPCLSELRIGNMPWLKGWSRNFYQLPIFRSMVSVEIWKCPRLTVMPYFRTDLTMIKRKPFKFFSSEVIFQDVSEKLLQLIFATWDHCVKIVSIQDMISLPFNIVANLPNDLEIEDCNQWQSFWTEQMGMPLFESFQRLTSLSIANCRAMKNLSSGLSLLICLINLSIYSCSEELDCLYDEDPHGMPWKALKSLSFLKIGCFEKLQAIPEGFRHLPQLALLNFTDCRSLKWGVDSLPKVEDLQIKSCPLFSEELKRQGHHDYLTDDKGFQWFDLRKR